MSVGTQAQLRSEILNIASGLLLGPLSPDEVIPSAPVDTYLTGILWPEGHALDALEDDQDDGASSENDGETDAAVPGYRAIRPCSCGVTFATDASAPVVVSLGTTARYRRVEGEPAATGGRPVVTWRRHELGYGTTIAPGCAASWSIREFDGPGGLVSDPSVELHVRRRLAGDQQVLTLSLINRSLETETSFRDELCLFQTMLSARPECGGGPGAIRPRAVPPPAGGDEDAKAAVLLYRHAVEYAVGHGVGVRWEPGSTGGGIASIETAWMPALAVKGMSSAGHHTLTAFLERHPDTFRAEWLGRADAQQEILSAMRDFANCYRAWITDELAANVGAFSGGHGDAARRSLTLCTEAAERIGRGIDALRDSPHAWTAFCLANVAMDRQARFPVKGDRAGPLTWRPFQLAYLLLVISGLVDPEDDGRDCVDLLWFPTGGGKTEAYLALTAFEIFLRRLTDAGRRSKGGVDVIMRYTLRLLTVQQFQRAASLIAACDAIRRERSDLGDANISLGLYVGGEATPNRIGDARTALSEEHSGQSPRSTPRQLLACPVCGHDLPPSCYSMPNDSVSMDIRCRNSACTTAGRPLPVMTVDDIIYDAPPSLLIGTIDKFAQLPRRKDLRALFGLDSGRRPGLIIQDELHLISGPLGSMAGLYETVVDMLCTEGTVRPKVIGSTATIGQAARQVRALFDRPVLQFPPSGFDARDSFFAVEDEDGADRIYVGLSSAGRSPKFALQAATAALLQAAFHLQNRGVPAADLDPFWTSVLYFNSLRELGGAHVLMQDDVPRQMAFLASRLGGTARALETEPVELSSRVASRDLPARLDGLGVTLRGPDASPFDPDPADTVLASNMISVGVDIPRLGLMIVNGQPKSTAEYIQASSRVGRGLPGLIITLYNFGRPRDVSHFEHFIGYHAALYRNVEATSVTPWAPRARDKALHAVLAAAVRHLVDDMEDEAAARDFNATDPEVVRVIRAIVARAASASEGIEDSDTAADLQAIAREWAQRSQDARSAGGQLLYWERKAPFGRTLPHLMSSAEEGGRNTRLAWPTPNSMREVEPSTAFILKLIQGS